jgi:hypothetical protein
MFWLGLAIFNIVGIAVILYVWNIVKKIGPGTYSGVVAAGAALCAVGVLLIMILGSAASLGVYYWSIHWPESFAATTSHLTFVNVALSIVIVLLFILLSRKR